MGVIELTADIDRDRSTKSVDWCRYLDESWDHCLPPMGPLISWWMDFLDHFSLPLGP